MTWRPISEAKNEWLERLQAEGRRATKAPGWNPKIVPLEGNLVCVDLCFAPNGGGLSQFAVVDYVDHPFLRDLPADAPRKVKAIYSKEVRMKHLRSADYWTISADLNAANEAWAGYA